MSFLLLELYILLLLLAIVEREELRSICSLEVLLL